MPKQEQAKFKESKIVIEPQIKVTQGPEIIVTDEPAIQLSEATEEMFLQELEDLEQKETPFLEVAEVSVAQDDTKLRKTKIRSTKRLIKDKPQVAEEEEPVLPKRPRQSSIGEVRASSGTVVSVLGPEFETFVGEESYSILGESVRDDLYNSLIQAISTTSVVTFSSITQNHLRLEVSKDITKSKGLHLETFSHQFIYICRLSSNFIIFCFFIIKEKLKWNKVALTKRFIFSLKIIKHFIWKNIKIMNFKF